MNSPFCSIHLQPNGSKKVQLGKKLIGIIDGQLFKKNVRGSRHMLLRVPGWAIDIDVLELLDEEGVTEIRIHDKETKKVYRASLLDFLAYGVPYHHPLYGPQLCLPLECWKTNKSRRQK